MAELNLGQLCGPDAQRDAVHIAIAPVVASELLQPGEAIGIVNGEAVSTLDVATPIGIVDPFLKEAVRVGERFWMWLKPGTITALRHEWTHPAFADVEAEDPPAPTPAPAPSPSPVSPSASWCTPTVLGICQRVREGDASALPILADALEDAGYTDEAILTECRTPHRGRVEDIVALRLLALIEGGERVNAVRRIESIASTLDLTYNALMEAAEAWVKYEEVTTQQGDEHWRDTFPELADEFWRHYETITGTDSERQSGSFFSCTC